MDYAMKFAWKFKCVFWYHFISRWLYGFNMWYMLEKQTSIPKKLIKNMNRKIIMGVLMTKFEPYFQKSLF
jgi:hypothetical protein